MKPGATAQPDASNSVSPSRPGPISWITPPAIATSATRPGAPLPSTTVPPRMTMSAGIPASLRQLHEVPELADRRPGGRPSVHREHDPGDLRRPVTGQVQDGVRHVDRTAVPLQRLGQLDDRAHVVVRDPGRDL